MQIYHPAFTTFIQDISQPVAAGEFTPEELDVAAELISFSLDFFKDESERQTKLHNWNNFGDLLSPHVKVNGKTIHPDGTTTVRCPSIKQAATIHIVELKNDIREGGSDPIMQAECGFVLICSSEEVALLVLLACIHTQLLLHSMNPFQVPRVAQCSLLGSSVRNLPSLVLSLQINLYHSSEQTTSTWDCTLLVKKHHPYATASIEWLRSSTP